MTYADSYDPMGGGGDDPRIHFSVRSKALLGWFGPKDILNITHSGRYRIFAEDQPGAAGARGLRIESDATNEYWVEFRQLISENSYLMNGVRILKCQADVSGKVDMTLNLLDMTPDSPPGCKDAPLLLGRTFCDDKSGIYMTPVGKGNTIPESVDIQVNLGHFLPDHQPTLGVIASARTATDGDPIVFRATAEDLDGNALEYSWDFGDESFDWGKSVVTHRWQETDRDFVVRCTVTDMKGGSASKLVLVTIGHPLLHHFVGLITCNGQPLENVLVAADTTNCVRTDSGGSFGLTGLESGNHRITARIGGYWINSAVVECPATGNITMTAVPLGSDTIESQDGLVLQDDDCVNTPATYRPPVEITVVAKTSATNLRLAYAADQVIFNWEVNGTELRVDGGPANGQHKEGMGAIPPNEYVAIKWLVTPKRQMIFVNNELRFEHAGDYSQIDRPVSVFAHQSTVTVKSIKVRQLPSGTQ